MALREESIVLERRAAWTAPIFYRTDAPLASSRVEPLRRKADRIDAERASGAISEFLSRRDDRTVLENVRVVRPFERVVLSAAGRRHEDLTPPRLEPIPPMSPDELASELRRRLIAAVARAAGDKKVAIMLSGGLDSSSVLAALLVARGAAADLARHVTLDFDAPGSDQPHVRALERHYGVVVSRIHPREATTHDVLVMDGAPSRHHGDPWTIVCARRAHELGAEILLTGLGGDQVYGGEYVGALTSALRAADLRALGEVFVASFPHRPFLYPRVYGLAVALLKPHVPEGVFRARARRGLRRLPPWMGPRMRAEAARVAEERVEARVPRTPQDRFERALTDPIESEFVSLARAQTNAVSPIPCVDPLYDEDLVYFLNAIPHHSLLMGASFRGLLRRSMRGLLPESVRTRPDKSDFEPAMADTVGSFDRHRALLTFERLGREGIVVPSEFSRYLEPLYAAPAAAANGHRWLRFWPALALEAFLRQR